MRERQQRAAMGSKTEAETEAKTEAKQPPAVAPAAAARELEVVFLSLDTLTPQLRRRVTNAQAERHRFLMLRRFVATVPRRRRRATDKARVTPRQIVMAVTLPLLVGLTFLLWLGH